MNKYIEQCILKLTLYFQSYKIIILDMWRNKIGFEKELFT